MATRDELTGWGLDWLLECNLLLALSEPEQDRLLADMSWFDARPGRTLVRAGRLSDGVWLLAAGTVEVAMPRGRREHAVMGLRGPGHLFGDEPVVDARGAAGAERTPSPVRIRTRSPVRALHLAHERFAALVAELPGLCSHLVDQREIREREPELLEAMAGSPVLRALGPEELRRLLQSAGLVRLEPGAVLVRRRDLRPPVYLVSKGAVVVLGAGATPVATLGRSAVIGHLEALIDDAQEPEVRITERAELIRIPRLAFRGAARANRVAGRRTLGSAAPVATEGVREPALVVAVYGTGERLGTTTLAWGAAGALACQHPGPVALVDLDGAASRAKLALAEEPVRIGEEAAFRLAVPAAWGPSVYRPADGGDPSALVAALSSDHDYVIVSVSGQSEAVVSLVRAADAVAVVSGATDDNWAIPDERSQFRVRVERVGSPEAHPVQGQVRHVVRAPEDPSAAQRFWRHRRFEALGDETTFLGRSCHRLARTLRGRTVGLALGGGGAWGFAHVGLLRALEGRVPVDYVAGTSFGAVVAGLYAAGGLAAVEQLVERRAEFAWVAMGAMVTTRVVAHMIDRLLGCQPGLGGTEIPFLPVAADIRSANQFILDRGTVGEGVRVSSGMPGLFEPVKRPGHRLVDGGVINNVPASVVWEAGADFVVAANVIPRRPLSLDQPGLLGRLKRRTTGRLDDVLRALYLLMWKVGADRAREADLTLELGLPGFLISEFRRGDEIADEAQRIAEASIRRITKAWAEDRSVHFGRGV